MMDAMYNISDDSLNDGPFAVFPLCTIVQTWEEPLGRLVCHCACAIGIDNIKLVIHIILLYNTNKVCLYY